MEYVSDCRCNCIPYFRSDTGLDNQKSGAIGHTQIFDITKINQTSSNSVETLLISDNISKLFSVQMKCKRNSPCTAHLDSVEFRNIRLQKTTVSNIKYLTNVTMVDQKLQPRSGTMTYTSAVENSMRDMYCSLETIVIRRYPHSSNNELNGFTYNATSFPE